MASKKIMNEKLFMWDRLTSKLKQLKKEESDLRDELFDFFFKTKNQEGVNIVDLGKGFTLKATVPYKRSIDTKKLLLVCKKLPKGLKAKLTRTAVSLVKKEYDELDEDYRAIFDDCLTVSPGKPNLEIVVPKKEATKNEK